MFEQSGMTDLSMMWGTTSKCSLSSSDKPKKVLTEEVNSWQIVSLPRICGGPNAEVYFKEQKGECERRGHVGGKERTSRMESPSGSL